MFNSALAFSSESAKSITFQTLKQQFSLPLRTKHRSVALATGFPPMDHALQGGLMAGTLVELIGAIGRMGVCLALTAQALRQGHAVAFLDGMEALAPQDLVALGQPSLFLWVRASDRKMALAACDRTLSSGLFRLVIFYLPRNPMTFGLEQVCVRFLRQAEQAQVTLLMVSPSVEVSGHSAARIEVAGCSNRWEPVPGNRWLLKERVLELTLTKNRYGRTGARYVFSQKNHAFHQFLNS